MMRWLALSVGSMVWGTLVFSLGLSLAFPGDYLKDHLSLMVQKNTQKKMLLHIGDASYSGIGGIALSQVSLFESKPGRRSPGEKATPPRQNSLMTSFDQVVLKPHLLSLFSGMVQADLGLKLTGGEVKASFGASPSTVRIASDTEDFDLSHHPLELDGDSVGLQGLLNIDGDIELNLDDIKESAGELAINIEDFGLTGGSISGFTLMETQFSESEIQFEIDDGKAKVTKGSFIGDMLEATVEGHITLRKDPLKSRLALKIQVRFDETLDKLAKIALKDSRDDDGVYHFKGRGTVTNPRWSAERKSKRPSSRRGSQGSQDDSSSRASKRPTRASSGLSDEDREARREKRKQRLKERRERMKKRREERRARQREREEETEYEEAIDEPQYEEQNIPPDPDLEDPVYEAEEIDPEYNEYEDENDPNGSMEDLGYIDE